MTLPAAMSATSGINAVAHEAEALYGQNTNPLTCVVAQEGIRAMAAALPKIMDDPLSQSARWDVSYVLPHALSYLTPNIPQALVRLAQVLPEGNGDAIKGLNILLKKLEVKRSLKEFGMKEGDIDGAAEIALSQPYFSAWKVERGGLGELIRQCWAGEEARVDL